ncbi:MAG TPA: hypothetical protein GX392_06650 [Clostridiales bacterium]|nr:hypothetical protein [Clostridiales bacterium]
MSKNLKIADNEFIAAEARVLAYIEILKDLGVEYISLVDSISNEAFQDILITNKLRSLATDMNSIMASLDVLSELLANKAKSFIQDIDEKDQFIY